MGEIIKILSIDGGGIRGAIPLYFLNQLEKKLNISIREEFDIVAGTSTGAIIGSSIITQNPSSGEYNSLDEILDIYINRSKQIFIQRESANTKYSNQGLELILKHFFGSLTLSQLDKILAIPLHQIDTDKHLVISQWSDKNFEGFKNVPLHKILLAAGASQGYFSPVKINESIYGDGVIQIKNPAAEALNIAINKGHEIKDIRILSLGTGSLDVIDDIENQSISTDQQLKYLFNKHGVGKSYLRIQPPIIEGSQDMDNTDVKNLKSLMTDANNYLKSNPQIFDQFEKILG